MNFSDDDDSVFEQALRADLPSVSEQNRLRQRLLAAGVAAGTALGSTNVAAATQASFGASALSKLSALSWPAKLALTAVLAAPVAALPLVYSPVRGAELVNRVQSSAAAAHARATAKTLSGALLQPSQAAPLALAPEPAATEQTVPNPAATLEPGSVSQANVARRAETLVASDSPAALIPSAASSANVGGSGPAVAVFDSPAPEASSSEAAPTRNATTLAAETQLLDRAFVALAAGDRKTASALVAEHARLFPNGLLRQERERARARIAADPTGE